jgi:hypothetical protein
MGSASLHCKLELLDLTDRNNIIADKNLIFLMEALPKHARGEIHTLGIFNAHVPSRYSKKRSRARSREKMRNTVRSLRLLPASVKLFIAFTLDLPEFDRHFRSSGAPEWLNPR